MRPARIPTRIGLPSRGLGGPGPHTRASHSVHSPGGRHASARDAPALDAAGPLQRKVSSEREVSQYRRTFAMQEIFCGSAGRIPNVARASGSSPSCASSVDIGACRTKLTRSTLRLERAEWRPLFSQDRFRSGSRNRGSVGQNGERRPALGAAARPSAAVSRRTFCGSPAWPPIASASRPCTTGSPGP